MPLVKKHFINTPMNDNTTGFSSKAGNPVIKFSIPAQPLMLETTTLHLIGQIQFKDKDDAVVANKGDAVALSTDDGSIAEAAPTVINLCNFGGVQNVIDKVVVTSKKSSVELVNESNYAQYTAIREGFSFNDDDYKRKPLNRNLSTGNNQDKLNRRVVITSGNTATPEGQKGQYFSLKLNIPMLQIQPILLDGQQGCGGLVITIYLSPDSNVLYNRHRHINAGNTATNDQTGASYLLKNVKLTGRYLVPSKQDLKAWNPVKVYGSRVNLINDIHSSVNSSGYTPQVQFVRSVVNQFQRSDAINNMALNSNNFPQVIGLEKVVQSKNGLRFPYDFNVDVVPNARSSILAGTTIQPQDLKFKSLGMGDSEVRLHHMKSILGGLPYHASVSLTMTENNTRAEYEVAGGDDEGSNFHADLQGVGADYSMGQNMIQNYMNQDYSVELTSGVNTGAANLPTDTRSIPFLQQTFVRNYEEIDLKKLVKIM